MLVGMGRFLLGTVALIAGLVVVGALAIWVLKALIGIIAYVLVGALVVGGGVYLSHKAKTAVGPRPRQRRARVPERRPSAARAAPGSAPAGARGGRPPGRGARRVRGDARDPG